MITASIDEGSAMYQPLQARPQEKSQTDAIRRPTAGATMQRPGQLDTSPQSLMQRKLAGKMHHSPRVLQQQALSDAIHNSPRMLAQRQIQRAIQAPASGQAIQRKIIHPSSWFPANKPTPLAYDAVEGLNSVTLDILTKTSKPEEIEGMGDPEINKTILDPSRENKQRLTKMHLIRGRFGAPGEVENLMLGTALSNNFDENSHYVQVEKPIADFLNEDKGKRMVDYKVTPYGDPPAYFDARLKKHPTAATFVGKMCPQIFACAVQFAKTEDNVNWFWSPQQIDHVRLDNKYKNGDNVVP